MNSPTPQGIRLENGFELVETATEMARNLDLPFVDITGFGELEWVELGARDDETVERLDGPFQLLDFKGRARIAGNLSLVDFVCTLSKTTDSGVQLTGGKLLRAQTIFAELTFIAVTEPGDTRSGVPSRSKEMPSQNKSASFTPHATQGPSQSANEKQPTPSADNKWKEAIQESEIIRRHAAREGLFDDETEIRPSLGDIVEHLQFGRCSVTRVDDDHIILRKPNGHNVQLGLTVLKFTPAGQEENHNVFRIEVQIK